MYCKKCGKQNPEGSKFCQHCGVKFNHTEETSERPHTSEHRAADDVLTTDKTPYPYVITIPKLIILSVATFGIYEVYWFYKQWKSFKAERDLKVTPWARAIFAGIMSYSLFKEVSKALRSADKTRSSLEAGGLAIGYFILMSLWKLPDPYWWLSLFSVAPLIPVQNAINQYWDIKYGKKVVASNFGAWNYIWSIIGGLVILLAIYGTSSSSSDLSSTTKSLVDTNNVKTEQASSNEQGYNQEEVVSSVVNIFCPSTVRGEETSGGSGTILTEDGIILTNSHVIPQDKRNLHVDEKGCIVVLPDSKTGQPKEIYMAHPIVIPDVSDKYDLAYMSIYDAFYNEDEQKYDGVYPRKFPAFNDTTRCTNQDLKLGESVRIFGYPAISGGYTLTVTDGLVSSFPGDGLIVTSAKISHGNSGGLAVDKNGCMVGVPSLVSSDDSESLGVIYSMNLVNKFSSEVSNYLKEK